MNLNELFLENYRERLLDLHSKLESKFDKLSYELGNNEDLSDEDREKLDQMVMDIYVALGDLHMEIL